MAEKTGYPGDKAIRREYIGKAMAVSKCAKKYGISSTEAFSWLHRAGLRKDGRVWRLSADAVQEGVAS